MKKLLVLAAVMQMSLLVAGEVNIKGLDKGALFKALYANAGGDADDLNDAGIQKASNGFVYFINGRLMRTDVSKIGLIRGCIMGNTESMLQKMSLQNFVNRINNWFYKK